VARALGRLDDDRSPFRVELGAALRLATPLTVRLLRAGDDLDTLNSAHHSTSASSVAWVRNGDSARRPPIDRTPPIHLVLLLRAAPAAAVAIRADWRPLDAATRPLTATLALTVHRVRIVSS
jgi:hypothetical protein